jgi:hypothetical protein
MKRLDLFHLLKATYDEGRERLVACPVARLLYHTRQVITVIYIRNHLILNDVNQ